jgi:bifunctional oligoribonuclease and PAP phosphatase NrnA
MKINPEIDQILKLMRDKTRFLITSHKDPDGDSVGSQLGLFNVLKNAGKQVGIINRGAMPEKYQFLNRENIIRFDNKPLGFIPEVVFVLECPSKDRAGTVVDLMPDLAIIVNIDHHQDNDNYGVINYVDIGCCAVGELVYNILKEGKYHITPLIAENLYAAILSDTGNFRFASTTARGMKAAAELIELGANPKMIFDRIFSNASPATIRLLGYTLASLKVAGDGKISYMEVTQDSVNNAQAKIEDSEGFVDYSLSVAGVKMGILFKEIGPSEIKISIRSQNGFDAAQFARAYDGGGHINAAGFTVNKPLEKTINEILTRAMEYVSR